MMLTETIFSLDTTTSMANDSLCQPHRHLKPIFAGGTAIRFLLPPVFFALANHCKAQCYQETLPPMMASWIDP